MKTPSQHSAFYSNKHYKMQKTLQLIRRATMSPADIMKGVNVPDGVKYLVFTDASGQSDTAAAGIGIVITTAEGHVLHEESHIIDDQDIANSTKRLETYAALVAMQRVPDDKVMVIRDNINTVKHLLRVSAGQRLSRKMHNLDLWKVIEESVGGHPGVHAQWIPSNAGNLGNELADTAARKNRNRPTRLHN